MSSHHVVKEDQEPALLLLDPDAIAFEKVQELLEWSPLVIVSYSSLKVILSWGIKIDVLVTATKNDTAQLVIDQAPLHIILSSDEDALESVCKFLAERKQVNLNIITSVAPALFARATSLSKKIRIVLFSGKIRWNLVENGNYSKWLPAQTALTIFENENVDEFVTAATGVLKIERDSAFWIGEEF